MRPLAIISLAMLAAACGASPGAPSSGQSSHNPAAVAFRYASCISEHGVPDFPDPHVVKTAGGGSVSQAVPAKAGLSPRFKTAQKACQGILPAQGSSSEHHGPSKGVLLAFAQCLRSHGISTFPDPNAQGELTREMISAAGVDIKGPALFSAAKACVGVTHGQITVAAVQRAINGPH